MYSHLTYAQVNEKANQVGRMLRDWGIANNDIVGLIMKSSIEMYLAILGILKAGGAYLPLSHKYPMERIHYAINDCNCKIVMTNIEDFNLDYPRAKLIRMNDPIISNYERTNLSHIGEKKDTAYVIYTSGTTGMPKGVLIDQENIINTLLFRKKLHDLSVDDVILQLNTYVFDGFVATFFTPLIAGAQIVAIEEENITDIEMLKEAIQKNRVTHFASIPMLYKEMIDNISSTEFDSVKSVVLAGDKVQQDIICRSQRKFTNTEIIIEYGVSECSVLSTYLKCGSQIEDKFFIGRPIDNHQVYVLNQDELLMPIGTIGELCISGIGVSNKGYLNSQGTKERKFIKHPFLENQILYKTGDTVRWLENGVLEYIGRKDNQVKIRGFRIELSEIEKQLMKHPAMQNVIVVTKKMGDSRSGQNSEDFICAYYVSKGDVKDVDENEIRQFLKGKIPEYMIPTFFQGIEQVPLTTNNKIDYEKLPPIDFHKQAEREILETETEKKLAAIWESILNIDSNIIRKNTTFFELGGHSLNIMKLLSRVNKEFGVKITVTEIYNNNEFRQICEMIEGKNKDEVIPITSLGQKEYYHVSSAQKRMYFLQELDRSGQAYLISSIKKLEYHVDVKRLEDTFRKIVGAHEVLRTSFHNRDGEIMQKIHRTDEVDFRVHIIDGVGEKREQIPKINRCFDLSKPVLLSVDLVRCSEELYYMIINIHHIIADGFSVKLLLDEFITLYQGGDIQEENLTYKDYAQWQNNVKGTLIGEREYWKEKLKGEIPLLNLPTDNPRPNSKSFNGDVVKFSIEKKNLTALKKISNQCNISMFVVILAVYNVFLAKVTGDEDIIVGIPTLGRNMPEIQNMIGMFANTLPMKNHVDAKQTFLEFLNTVKENSANDLDNEQYQYEDIINELNIERKINRNPLFDTMLNFEDIDMPVIEIDGMRVTDCEYARDTSKFDLTLNCINPQNKMTFEFEYDTQLFKKETIYRYIDYLKNIIDEVCVNVNRPIREIQMLSRGELNFLLKEYNATAFSYPHEKTVMDLFEEQVAAHPDALALKMEDEDLTYLDLSKQANALGNKLIAAGVEKGDVIGIMLHRSFELIISILATLKVGAVYIPIGSEYDSRKITHILENSKAKGLILSQKENLANEIRERKIEFVLDIDIFLKNEVGEYEQICENRGKPVDSAYIIYTSGSTGIPKGVEITNRNLMNYLYWAARNYLDEEVRNFPLFTSVSFDLTVTSIFTPLITGNTVVIYDDINIIETLKKIVKDESIQIIKLTPSHLEFLTGIECDGSAIKRIIVGGENLTVKLAQKTYECFGGNVDIINEYGPTEATVGCMIYHYSPQKDAGQLSVPIGKPAANMQVYLLDKNQNILPKGIKGEIYLSGDSIAKGYSNDEKQTTEKFVKNPFVVDTVMYKTGDTALMNQNGDIIFIGRNDRQIKHNGYRIELSEIEHAILTCPGVQNAKAIVIEVGRTKKLILSVLADDCTVTEEMLNDYMKSKLPHYMRVDRIVLEKEMPYRESGKVDVNYLREKYEHIYGMEEQKGGTTSRTDEEKILRLWQKVLDKEEIGFHENFFEAGGDSLRALKMKSMLEEAYGTEINVTVIFEYPTIRLMSQYFNELQHGSGREDEREEDEREDEISLMIQNLGKLVGDEYAEEDE